jgi:hypothetical protein
VIREAHTDLRGAGQDRRELLVGDLRTLLTLPPVQPFPPDQTVEAPPAYCRWIDRLQGGPAPPKTDEEAIPAHQLSMERQGASPGPEQPAAALQRAEAAPQQPAPQQPAPRVQGPKPAPRVQQPGVPPQRQRPVVPKRPTGITKTPPALNFPRPAPVAGRIQLSNWAQVATAADRAKEADRRADRYAVEVHKKWSISFACISFVIVGLVMALRFPRGGIGLVIGGGMLVFSIHYVGLTAGESLADRGLVSPWQAMWAPNIILTVVGLIGLLLVSRESGSTRGGDFQEVTDAVRHLFRRLRRRPASAGG